MSWCEVTSHVDEWVSNQTLSLRRRPAQLPTTSPTAVTLSLPNYCRISADNMRSLTPLFPVLMYFFQGIRIVKTYMMHALTSPLNRTQSRFLCLFFVEPLFPPACRVIVVSSKSVCVEISLFKAQQSSASCVRFACVTREEQTLEEINTKNDAKITAFHHQAESEIN